MSTVRLRQVALVARQLEPAATELRAALGLGEPFSDPGIAEFGLENAVFAVGDTFLEVVAPLREGTTAGRYLDRRGGDAGYMAIFQLPDLDDARRRVADMGVRVVWQADFNDIAGTHLHPKDVPGAIVSLDWADPPESWRWAGPAWIGRAPEHPPGGIVGLAVQARDPEGVADRWAAVLGRAVEPEGDVPAIALDRRRQHVTFEPAPTPADEGISAVTVALPAGQALTDACTVANVRFVVVTADATEEVP